MPSLLVHRDQAGPRLVEKVGCPEPGDHPLAAAKTL